MLKMKLQHRKQGNREHVLYVQCAVCIVCAVMSQCPSFFEVGSIQDTNVRMGLTGYTKEVCEVSLTKNLRGKTNLDWKSLGKF